MQHTSNSPDCGASGSADESRGSGGQLPVSLGSTDAVHYLRERIHIATLEKEMETLEAERDRFARQVEELETELEQLEDEVDSLEGIIEQKDDQLQQVIANYEAVIDRKHDQQMDGKTIEEFESPSPSGFDRVFSWIK